MVLLSTEYYSSSRTAGDATWQAAVIIFMHDGLFEYVFLCIRITENGELFEIKTPVNVNISELKLVVGLQVEQICSQYWF